MKIAIEIAKKNDNEELLRLMAEMPMPGPIQVAYRRDPDIFNALRVEGKINQVIVGRDMETSKVVGMGVRSIKPVFVNGQRMDVGYLSSLRVLKDYRKTLHLARGYKILKELHQDGRVPFYLSTILNDNVTAKTLVSQHARLPAYHDIGQFNSMAISLSQSLQTNKRTDISIRPATLTDIPLLVQFLNIEGKRRQFFPVYSEADLFNPDGILQGIKTNDILMAFIRGNFKGVLASWDQSSFRKSTVTGYASWLSLIRPFYNIWAKGIKLPSLPAVGSDLDYFYLSLVCIQNNDNEVFSSLLNELITRKKGHYSFMMAGMHEEDPLLPELARFRHYEYLSRLYIVCWEDGEKLFAGIDDRVPYLEIGAL